MSAVERGRALTPPVAARRAPAVATPVKRKKKIGAKTLTDVPDKGTS